MQIHCRTRVGISLEYLHMVRYGLDWPRVVLKIRHLCPCLNDGVWMNKKGGTKSFVTSSADHGQINPKAERNSSRSAVFTEPSLFKSEGQSFVNSHVPSSMSDDEL